jgi:hypothetical protein
MNIPTAEQLKWVRKNNLKLAQTPLTVDRSYIVYPYSGNTTVLKYKTTKESSITYNGYNGKNTNHIFIDNNNNEIEIYTTEKNRIYEIPENIETVIPPIATEQEKANFPNETQLTWFRLGNKPSYEPENTRQYYLKPNKTPVIGKYYLFKTDTGTLRVGYLFNIDIISRSQYNGANGDTNWNETKYEFRAVDDESNPVNAREVFDIPETLPTSPPPPRITAIFKRIISIKISPVPDQSLLYTLTFHDNSEFKYSSVRLKRQDDTMYIEVNGQSITLIHINKLLTVPNESISGTHVNLEAIQGTCSEGDAMKKLFMKFYIQDQPTNSPVIPIGNVTLDELKTVMDETDKLTKNDLQGLCTERPPPEIMGPDKNELVELTRDLTDDEKKLETKTYVIIGDYTCKVKLVGFIPAENGNIRGEEYNAAARFKISSMAKGSDYKGEKTKIYLKKTDMEDIETSKKLDKQEQEQQSDIYYKQITRTVKKGDEVYFYDPADTDKETAIKGKVSKINKEGILSSKVVSYDVEYSDESQTTEKTTKKTTVVTELYEIDKSKTKIGGRRRKTRNVFKKKHSQNKRTSRTRNSLKRKSLNKRHKRRTRKYS